MPHLLPPNATPQEQALEQASTRASDLKIGIPSLWHPQTCPVALLPWLAWALSVDQWDSEGDEHTQRAVIEQSARGHRYKGTPGSIRTLLRGMGFGEVRVIEGLGHLSYQGHYGHQGYHVYGAPEYWACYRVIFQQLITTAEASRLKKALKTWAPARCHLVSLEYPALRYDFSHQAQHQGQYSYGSHA